MLAVVTSWQDPLPTDAGLEIAGAEVAGPAETETRFTGGGCGTPDAGTEEAETGFVLGDAGRWLAGAGFVTGFGEFDDHRCGPTT